MKIHRTYKFEEGPTSDTRYSIRLLDKQGRVAHESKGDTRWHSLHGLVDWGFDVEWEPGETPEPKPVKPKPASVLQDEPRQPLDHLVTLDAKKPN